MRRESISSEGGREELVLCPEAPYKRKHIKALKVPIESTDKINEIYRMSREKETFFQKEKYFLADQIFSNL